MVVDSGRDGEPTDCGETVSEPTDRGEPSGPESSDTESAGDGAGREEPSGGVHVRRLGAGDTLRWSWATLRDRPELVGVAFAANLPSVAAAAGISRPLPSAELDVAAWVWPAYLVQLLGVAVVAGVAYLTAADAVALRSRPLTARVRTATSRVPSLVATGVVFVVAVALGLVPAFALDGSTLLPVGAGLVGALFSAYAFHRLLLSFPACVVDATGPLASARAGWAAATGTVWKVFAVGVAYVVAAVASTLVSGLFGGGYDVASTVVSASIGALVLPLFGLALAHLYLEGSRNR